MFFKSLCTRQTRYVDAMAGPIKDDNHTEGRGRK